MRRALALSIIALFSASMTTIAFAHAAYESSDPDNGSTVSSPPSRVIADFTERLSPDASSLSVFDPCGAQVDNGDSLIANDRITISMSANKQGTYVVRFQVLSAVDGHPTSGQFSFTSTGGEPCPDESDEEDEQQADEPEPGDDRPRNGDAPAPGESREEREAEADSRTSGRPRAGEETSREGSASKKTRAERGDIDIDSAAPSVDGIDLGAGKASIWDGIPMGDFLIALAVAALIGAAGGRIYAGIVGPRK